MRRILRPIYLGFSLLELCLVVTALAVLLALAFPVSFQLRERSRQVQCIKQLRDVGAAVLAVAVDNGGRLPALGRDSRNQHPTWGMRVAAAMNMDLEARAQRTAFWCPSDRTVESSQGAAMHRNHIGHSSYSANAALVDWETGSSALGGNARGGAPLGAIGEPGRAILLIEVHNENNVISWSDQGAKTWQKGWTLEYTRAGKGEHEDPGKKGYHKGMNNWLFADGHIESLKFNDTLEPINLWKISN